MSQHANDSMIPMLSWRKHCDIPLASSNSGSAAQIPADRQEPCSHCLKIRLGCVSTGVFSYNTRVCSEKNHLINCANCFSAKSINIFVRDGTILPNPCKT